MSTTATRLAPAALPEQVPFSPAENAALIMLAQAGVCPSRDERFVAWYP